MLRHVILENESSTLTVPEIVKQLTIKDAVYWSAQAWEAVFLKHGTSLSLQDHRQHQIIPMKRKELKWGRFFNNWILKRGVTGKAQVNG